MRVCSLSGGRERRRSSQRMATSPETGQVARPKLKLALVARERAPESGEAVIVAAEGPASARHRAVGVGREDLGVESGIGWPFPSTTVPLSRIAPGRVRKAIVFLGECGAVGRERGPPFAPGWPRGYAREPARWGMLRGSSVIAFLEVRTGVASGAVEHDVEAVPHGEFRNGEFVVVAADQTVSILLIPDRMVNRVQGKSGSPGNTSASRCAA